MILQHIWGPSPFLTLITPQWAISVFVRLILSRARPLHLFFLDHEYRPVPYSRMNSERWRWALIGYCSWVNLRIFQTGLYDKHGGKQWYGIDTRCAGSKYKYSAVASTQGSDKTYYKTGRTTFGVDRGHLNPSGKWKPVCSELFKCLVELYKDARIFKNTREVHREARRATVCFSHFSSVFKISKC